MNLQKLMRTNVWLRYFLQVAFTAAVYFTLARLSLYLQFENSNATPVWPPSGFAFAAMLIWGYRIAPGIFFGAFTANLIIFISNRTVDYPVAIWLSSLIGAGNTAEALLGNFLLRKLIPEFTIYGFLRRTGHIFYFTLTAALMSSMSSFIGTIAVLSANIIQPGQFPLVLLTWWLGDFSGVLLITSLILIWLTFLKKKSFRESQPVRRPTEYMLLLICLVVVSGTVFLNWLFPFEVFNYPYWIIPVFAWAALRFGRVETITSIAICSVLAVIGTVNHLGTFGDLPLNEALISLQAFISIMVITKLAMNVTVMERRATEAALRNTGVELEKRVKERTAELVEREQEIREQKAVAEQKNIDLQKTNAELSSFAYVASHDLQEPLRKIQMFSNRIIETDHDLLSENSKDYFIRMKNAAHRMQQLIEDLLTYSRTGNLEKRFEKICLTQLVNEASEDLKDELLQNEAQIETGELCECMVIPFQFRQLLYNLMSNAIKFSKPGVKPHIKIKSQIGPGNQFQNPALDPMKQYCHMEVSDNGIGFEPEFNEQIFGLFQRLHGKNEYPGTGIGLAICKKIIENHQGIITAQGRPGIGTTFDIYIPHPTS